MTGDESSSFFDHLDDPAPPAAGRDTLDSVVHRGRQIRTRRQGMFAAGSVAAVTAAVIGGLGISHAVSANGPHDSVAPPLHSATASPSESPKHKHGGGAVVVPGGGTSPQPGGRPTTQPSAGTGCGGGGPPAASAPPPPPTPHGAPPPGAAGFRRPSRRPPPRHRRRRCCPRCCRPRPALHRTARVGRPPPRRAPRTPRPQT